MSERLGSELISFSECERAIQRYDEWMQLREQARINHEQSGSTAPLPKALLEPPPERPEPYQEEDLADVSVDMTANGFDASESFTLDRSIADDIVPDADPGLDRPTVSKNFSSKADIQPVTPVGLGIHGREPPAVASPTQAAHLRRKSVLPIDPAVRRDLEVSMV